MAREEKSYHTGKVASRRDVVKILLPGKIGERLSLTDAELQREQPAGF